MSRGRSASGRRWQSRSPCPPRPPHAERRAHRIAIGPHSEILVRVDEERHVARVIRQMLPVGDVDDWHRFEPGAHPCVADDADDLSGSDVVGAAITAPEGA